MDKSSQRSRYIISNSSNPFVTTETRVKSRFDSNRPTLVIFFLGFIKMQRNRGFDRAHTFKQIRETRFNSRPPVATPFIQPRGGKVRLALSFTEVSKYTLMGIKVENSSPLKSTGDYIKKDVDTLFFRAILRAGARATKQPGSRRTENPPGFLPCRNKGRSIGRFRPWVPGFRRGHRIGEANMRDQ